MKFTELQYFLVIPNTSGNRSDNQKYRTNEFLRKARPKSTTLSCNATPSHTNPSRPHPLHKRRLKTEVYQNVIFSNKS